ncbi:MAG: energy transducer TonB [Serratia liquefaciens]|nr:energy transducer TonB [Serratia liquefaciens]
MLKFLFTILMVFSLNACVTEGPKPKLVSRANPVYPIYAYDNKIEGYAKVKYDVDKDGKVSEIRNLEITVRFKMSRPISQ